MAIDIVDFPIKNGGSFHSFLYVHQRVFMLHSFQLSAIFVFVRQLKKTKKAQEHIHVQTIATSHTFDRFRRVPRVPYFHILDSHHFQMMTFFYVAGFQRTNEKTGCQLEELVMSSSAFRSTPERRASQLRPPSFTLHDQTWTCWKP